MHPDTTPNTVQPTAGMSDDVAAAEARRIIANAYRPAPDTPTAYRDDTPVPAYGSTPPVVQPGTPPMSQRAVDASRLMLTGGLATVPPGLVAIGLLIASEHADPTVIGMICAAPAAVAVPILAIARLLRRATGVVPDVHHHHYNGPVRHETTITHTRGLIARTHNELD
ncbi:hypothetical protein [Streptomyces lavenduligriseus]|uniref:Uncharacterized protein n=1 Tax=Streptomyces lavenduligriseus TaxID=67315 RepID=A0ABT0P514_9ACTN|nr:hypothetical protein [Streptomyces lavenduligriseus]MCL3998008.1 hypothetical protein [Streptomyces lavenduligriseus]